MIGKLTAKELKVLGHIDKNEELRPLFFRKVKGLKWFCALNERGFFAPHKNPTPEYDENYKYYFDPPWYAIKYLEKTAPELSHAGNSVYAEQFIKIIVDATIYAKENGFHNWRTWLQFSETISQIPYKSIALDKVDVVDYWFDKDFDNGAMAYGVGETWLPHLLRQGNQHAYQLAERVLYIFYKPKFIRCESSVKGRMESVLRFYSNYTTEFTDKVARLAGETIGADALKVFDAHLATIFDELKTDQWSWMWQPAIEQHTQDRDREHAEKILIRAYRVALDSYTRVNPTAASDYVKGMLDSDYQTIQRLAIHAIGENFHLFADVVDELLDEKYLADIFWHETWHYLNKNYLRFDDQQKAKSRELILQTRWVDNNGVEYPEATAFRKSAWLSAIKNYGEAEEKLYTGNTKIANAVPVHPDFYCYSTSGVWRGQESPISLIELKTLSIGELVDYLKNYKDPGKPYEPGLQGLLKMFGKLIRTDPYRYSMKLSRFLDSDFTYLNQIMETYRQMWVEKVALPWQGMWKNLFEFCLSMIAQERFSLSGKETPHDSSIVDRNQLVINISELIKARTRSSEHAFNREHLQDAEKIIGWLLDNGNRIEFMEDSDAVFESNESPRGHCLKALINLTFRSCQVSDKSNNNNHSAIWEHFQPYYDKELELADSKNPEYEFVTLVMVYLPSFQYFSKEWVSTNLDKIFDQNNYLKWLCAMKGYISVTDFDNDLYNYLKKHGDLLKALDDQNLRKGIWKKVVEDIAKAYLNDIEKLQSKGSIIRKLVDRDAHEELKYLVWYIEATADSNDAATRNRAYELWSFIQHRIDFSTQEGKKLASQLCRLAVFIDQIDEERLELLSSISPYAHLLDNDAALLKAIAEISETQPFEAYKILAKMPESPTPKHAKKAINKVLANLLRAGADGDSKAKAAVNEFLRHRNEWPQSQLEEVRSAV